MNDNMIDASPQRTILDRLTLNKPISLPEFPPKNDPNAAMAWLINLANSDTNIQNPDLFYRLSPDDQPKIAQIVGHAGKSSEALRLTNQFMEVAKTRATGEFPSGKKADQIASEGKEYIFFDKAQ